MTTKTKKLLMLIVALITSTTIFIGCNDVEEDSALGSHIKKKLYEYGVNFNIISYSSGGSNTYLLKFANRNDFEHLFDALSYAQNMYDSLFIDSCITANPSALYFVNDSIGLDEYKVLDDFISKIGFNNSMLSEYKIIEHNWLSQEYSSLDSTSLSVGDPANMFPFDDAYLALINNRGEVMIGDTILKYTNSGCIAITDGNLSTLIDINNGLDVSNYKNVIVLSINEQQSNCKSYSQKIRYFFDNSYYGLPLLHNLKIKFSNNFLHFAVTSVVIRSYITLENPNTKKYKNYKISGVRKGVHANMEVYDFYCKRIIRDVSDWDHSRKHKLVVYVSKFDNGSGPLKFVPNSSVWGGYTFGGSSEQGFYLY